MRQSDNENEGSYYKNNGEGFFSDRSSSSQYSQSYEDNKFCGTLDSSIENMDSLVDMAYENEPVLTKNKQGTDSIQKWTLDETDS